MQTVTIQKDRWRARDEYQQYRKAVRVRRSSLKSDLERRLWDEDEALRRAHLELARGFKVLDLAATMKQAGVFFATSLPKFAIIRADQTECFCRVERSGVCHFHPSRGYTIGVGPKNLHFRFREGIFPPVREELTGRAMVPSVPPSLRPAGDLSRYYILWEAVWTREPPADPLLLKRLSPNLFSVLAAWDLTDLERAALNSRFVS